MKLNGAVSLHIDFIVLSFHSH